MSIPLNRLEKLCPPEWRDGLSLLSPRQKAGLRRKIRDAIWDAKRRKGDGHQQRRYSRHPLAAYWRERYQLKKQQKANHAPT